MKCADCGWDSATEAPRPCPVDGKHAVSFSEFCRAMQLILHAEIEKRESGNEQLSAPVTHPDGTREIVPINTRKPDVPTQ